MDNKMQEMFEIIENDIKYANKIVNDLLDFSREIHLQLSKANVKEIVKEVLTEIEIPGNIKVVNATKGTHTFTVDVNQIKRVFHNIIRNAIQAMPNGGTLTITSKKTKKLVKISFHDTGIGISKRNMSKLFKPLFTTKAKGIGLGLPICKRIIKAHGGRITVKSEVGKGTCFTVILPLKTKKAKGGEKSWKKEPEYSLSMMTPAYVKFLKLF
jgi:signal transduction histidine kinase